MAFFGVLPLTTLLGQGIPLGVAAWLYSQGNTGTNGPSQMAASGVQLELSQALKAEYAAFAAADKAVIEQALRDEMTTWKKELRRDDDNATLGSKALGALGTLIAAPLMGIAYTATGTYSLIKAKLKERSERAAADKAEAERLRKVAIAAYKATLPARVAAENTRLEAERAENEARAAYNRSEEARAREFEAAHKNNAAASAAAAAGRAAAKAKADAAREVANAAKAEAAARKAAADRQTAEHKAAAAAATAAAERASRAAVAEAEAAKEAKAAAEAEKARAAAEADSAAAAAAAAAAQEAAAAAEKAEADAKAAAEAQAAAEKAEAEAKAAAEKAEAEAKAAAEKAEAEAEARVQAQAEAAAAQAAEEARAAEAAAAQAAAPPPSFTPPLPPPARLPPFNGPLPPPLQMPTFDPLPGAPPAAAPPAAAPPPPPAPLSVPALSAASAAPYGPSALPLPLAAPVGEDPMVKAAEQAALKEDENDNGETVARRALARIKYARGDSIEDDVGQVNVYGSLAEGDPAGDGSSKGDWVKYKTADAEGYGQSYYIDVYKPKPSAEFAAAALSAPLPPAAAPAASASLFSGVPVPPGPSSVKAPLPTAVVPEGALAAQTPSQPLSTPTPEAEALEICSPAKYLEKRTALISALESKKNFARVPLLWKELVDTCLKGNAPPMPLAIEWQEAKKDPTKQQPVLIKFVAYLKGKGFLNPILEAEIIQRWESSTGGKRRRRTTPKRKRVRKARNSTFRRHRKH
jgi:hypothetical protein